MKTRGARGSHSLTHSLTHSREGGGGPECLSSHQGGREGEQEEYIAPLHEAMKTRGARGNQSGEGGRGRPCVCVSPHLQRSVSPLTPPASEGMLVELHNVCVRDVWRWTRQYVCISRGWVLHSPSPIYCVRVHLFIRLSCIALHACIYLDLFPGY